MLEISNPAPHHAGEPTLHQYSFGPFHLSSEILLPELLPLSPTESPDPLGGRVCVDIRVEVRPSPAHARSGPSGLSSALLTAPTFGPLCRVLPDQYLLNIPGVASFLVQFGREVRVEPANGRSPYEGSPELTTYLLGSVFGALCHQNGILPLHASAVRTPSGITAFVGDSGAGKSTLAACLERRGYPVVADDICVLTPAFLSAERPSAELHSAALPSTELHVCPVNGWLKLWRQSLDHLGRAADPGSRISSEDDKYRVPLRVQPLDPSPAVSSALSNIIFLARSDSPEPCLEPISPTEAIAGLIRFTYLGYIVELTGSYPRIFRQCASVVAGARAFRLTVPWGLAEIERTLDLLAQQIL